MRCAALLGGIAVSLLVTTSVWADAKPVPEYKIDTERSKIKFVALQEGAPVQGSFAEMSGVIRFDPERLNDSSFVVQVPLESVFTEDEQIADELKKPGWFNVSTYPTATLRSVQLYHIQTRDGSFRRQYYADAELELKGQIVPVTVNFLIDALEDDIATANGRISLLRTDFNVGEGEWASADIIEDVVSVTFRVVGTR